MTEYSHKRMRDKIADVIRQVNERKQLEQANGIIPMPPTFDELEREKAKVVEDSQR